MHRKDVVLMNAELDGTIGPILQTYADQHGVILTGCEGDEPGVQMNLYRWVKGLSLTPRLMGNVKGLQDPYRNPTTQQGFAERWGQNAAMVTGFADGSKISFEQTIVANATGFKVRSRGMSRGRQYTGDVLKIGELYDVEVAQAWRRDRLCCGDAADQGLLPGRASRPQAAALSEPGQDRGRGRSTPSSSPIICAFRSAERDCSRCAVPRSDHQAVWRSRGRSLRRRQARPQGR